MENDNQNEQPNTEGKQVVRDNQSNQNQPFAIFPDAKSFNARLQREATALQREMAKEMGFDSIEAMKEFLQKNKPDQTQTNQQQQPAKQDSEMERLRLSLQVATELNLPAVLIGRLQGSTVEELKADAEKLQALISSNSGGQLRQVIPSSQTNKPVTFTKQQLSDPAFVRANRDAILQAGREGRIN